MSLTINTKNIILNPQTVTTNAAPPPAQTVLSFNGVQWITVPVPCLPSDPVTCSEEKKKVSEGCVCKKCKEFCKYAEPNQEDGTLICYGCRMVW